MQEKSGSAGNGAGCSTTGRLFIRKCFSGCYAAGESCCMRTWRTRKRSCIFYRKAGCPGGSPRRKAFQYEHLQPAIHSRLQQLLFGNRAALVRAVNHFPDEMMLEFLHQSGLHGTAAKEEWDVFAGIAKKSPSAFLIFPPGFLDGPRECCAGSTFRGNDPAAFSTFTKEIISEIYTACAEREDHEAFRQYTLYLEPLTGGQGAGEHNSIRKPAGPGKQRGNKERTDTEDTVTGESSSHEQAEEKQRTQTSQDIGETANTLTPVQTGRKKSLHSPHPENRRWTKHYMWKRAGLILLPPLPRRAVQQHRPVEG